jgi:hypothetical protein
MNGAVVALQLAEDSNGGPPKPGQGQEFRSRHVTPYIC